MQETNVVGFLLEPWKPRLYSKEDLAYRLGMDLSDANDIITTINGTPGGKVTHHDLVEYLVDLRAIAKIPTSVNEISVAGIWLVQERGWIFDPRYPKYRWANPKTRLHHTLRVALQLELEKLDSEEGQVVVLQDEIPQLEVVTRSEGY